MSNLDEIYVPLAIATGSYMFTNNGVTAGVLTIAGTYLYFMYKGKAYSRPSIVDGKDDMSVNSTSLNPTKVDTKPPVIEINHGGKFYSTGME